MRFKIDVFKWGKTRSFHRRFIDNLFSYTLHNLHYQTYVNLYYLTSIKIFSTKKSPQQSLVEVAFLIQLMGYSTALSNTQKLTTLLLNPRPSQY